MKPRLILFSMFSIYDMLFNIFIPTASVISQTSYLIALAIILIVSNKQRIEPLNKWNSFVSWANICYWLMAISWSIYNAVRYPNFYDWVSMSTDKSALFIFYMIALVFFFSTWYLWKVRKFNGKH